jgi:hypothetical protein
LCYSRLGHAHTTHHRIELTPGAKPVHSHPYRAGPRARGVEAAEVQRMLKAGVIEPSTTEWASPVVLVPKPDGSMRFCNDYRRLNALTFKEGLASRPSLFPSRTYLRSRSRVVV